MAYVCTYLYQDNHHGGTHIYRHTNIPVSGLLTWRSDKSCGESDAISGPTRQAVPIDRRDLSSAQTISFSSVTHRCGHHHPPAASLSLPTCLWRRPLLLSALVYVMIFSRISTTTTRRMGPTPNCRYPVTAGDKRL
jgi:hypothetical protein